MAEETIVLLMTDIEDSTGGWDRNRHAMQQLLEAYIDLVERRLQPPPRIENFTGDGHLLSFPTVDSAATAALRLREAWEHRRATFNRSEWAATHRLRMGIHIGRVVRLADGDRIIGSPINVCARTMKAAAPGEILVSETAMFDFRTKDRYAFGNVRIGMPAYPLIGLGLPGGVRPEAHAVLSHAYRMNSETSAADEAMAKGNDLHKKAMAKHEERRKKTKKRVAAPPSKRR